MKIEKLPSGSYRVRKMYKGKMYAVTFEYKPTQKEALEAMAKRLSIVQGKNEGLTFEAAAREYIESKRNVLSPSTIRGYNPQFKPPKTLIFLGLFNFHDKLCDKFLSGLQL